LPRRRLTTWGLITCLASTAAGLSLGYISWLEFAGWYFADNRLMPLFLLVFGLIGFSIGRMVALRWNFAARWLLIGASLGAILVHLWFVHYLGSWDLSHLQFADVFVLEAFYLSSSVLLGGMGYIIARGINQLCRI